MKKSLLAGILSLFIAALVMGQAQMPNGDLEEWDDSGLGYEDPTHWQTPNAALLLTTMFTTLKSTDAVSGTYSAKLETKEVAGGFIAPGVITLGNFDVDYTNFTAYLTGGIPFTDRPLSLKGNFKNYPVENDSTLVAVLFTEYLPAKGKRDTIGFGIMHFSETFDFWANFTIPIHYTNDHTPDTMNLFVVSSNMVNPTKGSIMYVDNLRFEYPAGVIDIENTVETSVFPNPASDNLSFSFAKEVKAELKIFSNDGQLVYSTGINGTDQKIDVSGLATGAYYYGLFEKSKRISSGQFVISR